MDPGASLLSQVFKRNPAHIKGVETVGALTYHTFIDGAKFLEL